MVDKADTQQKVLFVCNWNATRSPLAETILDQLSHSNFMVSSAGVESSDYVDSFIISLCLKKYDVNLIHKAPVSLQSRDDLNDFTLFIALSSQAYSHIKYLKNSQNLQASIEYWETPMPPDKNQPRDMIEQGYETLHNEIKSHIENRFSDYL